MSGGVGSYPQYEEFADEYSEHARDGLYNAHLDRPACLEMLGDVSGKRVLDAACGPGHYAAELTRRGASVVGFDISPRMVELSRERVPAGDFRIHELGEPMQWLEDASVDLVLCALALEYVDNRIAALREFHRVLRPDGAVVISRQHPTSDWLRNGGSYYETRVLEETWSKGWRVRYWLAPLQASCDEFAEAGFVIERIVEPLPTSAARDIDALAYERLQREPNFLAFRLIPKP